MNTPPPDGDAPVAAVAEAVPRVRGLLGAGEALLGTVSAEPTVVGGARGPVTVVRCGLVPRRTTVESRHGDGRWTTELRETYDRGNGATILL